MNKIRVRLGIAAATLGVIMTSLGSGAQATPLPSPKTGGAVTALYVGSSWSTLDPALNTNDAQNFNYMNAIYGQLFEAGPSGKILPDLATGYKVSDGSKTITISLRHGVTFQDGSPFNAQAVQASIQADLLPANACICLSDFKTVTSVTTTGAYTVVLHLTQPDAAIMSAFFGEAPNWTVSPTALAAEGAAKFGLAPVGAGPFSVVSNIPSSKLVLARNPKYWEKGRPYLDSLTFESVGTEQSALEALQSGSAQFVQNIAMPQNLTAAKQDSDLKVTTLPGIVARSVALNTRIAPFNNIQAREALYYATDSRQLVKSVITGLGSVAESPTGPGGLFYEKSVPGYREYNLQKAKALVSGLGGLTVNLIDFSPADDVLAEALASLWHQAGITVNLAPLTFSQYVAEFSMPTGWQASITSGGSYDPAIGTAGLANRVGSTGTFSGVADPALDASIDRAQGLPLAAARAKAYRAIFEEISAKAYVVYLYAVSSSVVTSTSIIAPALVVNSNGPVVQWENVSSKS